MAGDDDRFVSHRSNAYFGGLDDPVDVSAGRIVDERIDAVPVGIAAMDNVRFGDRDGYIAVRVRGTLIPEVKRGPIKVLDFFRREGLARNGRQRDDGKLKSQSSNRWATSRCLWVFSWAMMASPSAFSHSLPSAWSKCQLAFPVKRMEPGSLSRH